MKKKPLYRKENKTSLQTKYYIRRGKDHRHTRHTKKFLNSEAQSMSMNSGHYGRDYAPLYNYLLKAVGRNWDDVYSEVKNRIGVLPDYFNPIFTMVNENVFIKDDGFLYKLHAHYGICKIYPSFRAGEFTYYSSLYVDENNMLRKVSNINKGEMLEVTCGCHTHSFNGKVFKGKIKID